MLIYKIIVNEFTFTIYFNCNICTVLNIRIQSRATRWQLCFTSLTIEPRIDNRKSFSSSSRKWVTCNNYYDKHTYNYTQKLAITVVTQLKASHISINTIPVTIATNSSPYSVSTNMKYSFIRCRPTIQSNITISTIGWKMVVICYACSSK